MTVQLETNVMLPPDGLT